MAVTEFQRTVCRIIAQNRIASGCSYVAGGTALNLLLKAPRVSRDIDIFHDTEEAVLKSWDTDRAILEKNGFSVQAVQERRSFVEAVVQKAGKSVLLEWTRDSSFRFFPLVEHEDFGLTLHPFDLATNKVLALAGRLEARDWIDVISCDQRLQKLGYLMWAACGKDPGFSPSSLLAAARRTGGYTESELGQLAFEKKIPDCSELNRTWHHILTQAGKIITLLPEEHTGCCVLASETDLCIDAPDDLSEKVKQNSLMFHKGSLLGAYPGVK